MDHEFSPQQRYEEIDIRDYVRVIGRRKWLIAGVVGIALAVAGVFSYQQPKVYVIESSFEVGIVSGQPIENPTHLVEKLKSLWREVEVTNPAGTSLIILSMESADEERPKEILRQIEDSVLQAHQKIIEQRKALNQEDLERVKDSQEIFQKQLARTFDGFQQYFLFTQINSLQNQIHSLQQEINSIQPTEIVREPFSSQESAGAKPVSNMVIAIVLGLFLGVFGALLKEWWAGSTKRKA